MTEVMLAAQRMTPKTRTPTSPSACWKAEAAGSSVARTAPPETTPSTARNSSDAHRAGDQDAGEGRG